MESQSDVAHRRIISPVSLLLFMAITHSMPAQFGMRANCVGDAGNVDMIGAAAVETVAVTELILAIDGVAIKPIEPM